MFRVFIFQRIYISKNSKCGGWLEIHLNNWLTKLEAIQQHLVIDSQRFQEMTKCIRGGDVKSLHIFT